MKKKRLLFLSLSLCLVALNGLYAQEVTSVQSALKPIAVQKSNNLHFADNAEWYLKVQGGLNFLGAEYTQAIGLGKNLSGTYGFAVGKNFTTYWGMRLHLLGGGDKISYKVTENIKSHYNFQHIGAYAEVTFNITTLFREDKTAKPWNVYAMFGPGFISSFAFDKEEYQLDLTKHMSFALYGGFETSYRFHPNWDVNFGITTNWMGDKFNGIVGGRKIEGHLNILFGISYIF